MKNNKEKTIVEQFVCTCMRKKTHIAIEDKTNQFSFSDIYTYSGRISFFIYELIKKQGSCIGVIIDGTAESLIMMLGVICSGNYYIPINGDNSPELICETIELTDAALVLLPNNYCSNTIKKCNIAYVNLNEILCRTSSLYFATVNSSIPLYAILTSGSTGYPKVILKSHLSMSEFVKNFNTVFSIGDTEVIGNQIPYYSDAAQKELYFLIYNGCRITIIPQYFFIMPYPLVDYINSHDISVLHWVPSAFNTVAKFDIFRKDTLNNIKYTFWVGERIRVSTVNYWKYHFPSAHHINIYGMSELAGICSYYNMKNELSEVVPIGKPLPHCTLAFFNGNTISDQGELIINSISLAESMLVHKDQRSLDTIDLYYDHKVQTFYKSGDIGYINQDGDFVVTGRKDDVIKINGYRIDITGTERVLERCDLVDDIAVVLFNNYLIAFIVLINDIPENRKTLWQYAKKCFPRYSQPRRFIFLSSLPYNNNGKKDKQMLLKRIALGEFEYGNIN